jgi:AhpD family alkylhydroperoxidase
MTISEARVPLLEREHVPPQVAQLYDTLLATRGVVPNMFKALSNLPPLVLAVAELLKPVMGEGNLSGWYKELVATLVASLNKCDYCVAAHTHLALVRGATPQQVESLSAFETGPFTEKEKVGFRYASLLHISGHMIDDSAHAAVAVHYNPQELLELTALAAAFEFFSRINTALRIPVTQLPEAK